ncbi:MAG: tRNA 2-thiocytidine biosynthesis protein TtcA [Candidatus Thiothrix singaporensis]|uniref:tRNA 2-thiocytidine biosynthesis protein TtcA n=1 Tax=Candidatus Thiothrix singaporensis TaxID=2799669 RepID=A0A7L6AUS7_9GAMM|nr:MAG: tRNA 2-thiocytidine biosynthesis protein TtcA [Candidatus Thiothrix singaporensis]
MNIAEQIRPEFVTPKSLLRQVGKAIGEYRLIREGDRILLGLSGGKDSLALLHILNHFQRHAPIRFEFAAVTIDPQSDGFDPTPLIPYMEALGVPYHYVREPIVKLAETHMDNDSYCAFCSRMKRGLMYRTAREQGYNVLALAQHLDDLAESFLMSAFHGGKLKTMKAHYRIDAGDLRVIRPLVMVRERQTADFAKAAELPVIVENCPMCFGAPTQRQHMKELLAAEERQHSNLFKSLLTAMQPLVRDGLEKT